MGKTNFNIVCSSSDKDSFSGNIYDARYFVNFATLITDEEYKKKYKVSLRFKTPLDADILETQTYLVSLIVNSKIYSQLNLGLSYVLAVLNKNVEDITTATLSLDCSPTDNPPVIVSSLDRMSSIGLQFNILETGGLFTGLPEYIAIINFESLD